MIAILTSVKWYLIVVLLCISLIISDFEHLFMCLLVTHMSSLLKCLFRISTIFFFLMSCMLFLYILEINPISVASLANAFSHSEDCLFPLFMFSFAVCKLLHLIRSYLGTSLVAQMVKCLPTMRNTWVKSLGQEDILDKEMATYYSILAWKIPWMMEPGRL